tara:strand:+ start:468 stop:893 length:426 start_codon:yes stop_codon:yes gene_type:complete
MSTGIIANSQPNNVITVGTSCSKFGCSYGFQDSTNMGGLFPDTVFLNGRLFQILIFTGSSLATNYLSMRWIDGGAAITATDHVFTSIQVLPQTGTNPTTLTQASATRTAGSVGLTFQWNFSTGSTSFGTTNGEHRSIKWFE